MSDERKSVIREKSFAFALRIVRLCKMLESERGERILGKQLLRSGTAIGALVREAEYAESRADFIHKMAIAQKEAGETAYWLELLHQSGLLSDEEFASIILDQTEIAKILASIILTSKGFKR
ncbi:MAG: four helix bundle protein [Candidatus Sumerlaeia bacterium]